MKSYSAYFVRSAEAEKAQAIFGNRIESLENPTWLMCGFYPSDSPPKDEVLLGELSLTTAKSKELGEIFFVYGDTSIEGFVYEHARDGQLLRKLVWFPLLDDDWTAGWVYVAGEPEAWEATLFSDRNLAQCLQNERYKLEDEGRSDEADEMEAELRQFWSQGQITAGKTFPGCDGTVALLVEESYGITRPI